MAQLSVNNGVNVDALLAAREALRNAPEAAEFTWRASCKWQNGTHARSTVRDSVASGRSNRTRPSSPSRPIIRRFSPPRTTVRRRSSWCWSVLRAA